MNNSISVTFSADSSRSDKNFWASLEQEYKKEIETGATMSDMRMAASYARAGESALSYLIDSCPYITIDGNNVVVSLDVFVWPSSMKLDYAITSAVGSVSRATIIKKQRSFDVLFQGAQFAEMPYIFEGELIPQMPHLNKNGSIIDNVTYEFNEGLVYLNKSAYTVFRANGVATGYKHTIVMDIAKINDVDGKSLAIENLKNTVTISWKDGVDEEGKALISTDELELDIPQCVTDILAYCGEAFVHPIRLLIYRKHKRTDRVEVYYSACDGEIVKERRVDKDGRTV